MERQIGMRLFERSETSAVNPVWVTVAYKDTVLDAIYHRASKRMLGIKSYRQLPKWQYLYFEDGVRGEYRFKYFVENYGIAGRERILQRRVCIYGFNDVAVLNEEHLDVKRQVELSFKRHALERVKRCKHGRLVRPYSPHGGCRKCRMALARDYKAVNAGLNQMRAEYGDYVSPLTPSDPDFAFFAERMLELHTSQATSTSTDAARF